MERKVFHRFTREFPWLWRLGVSWELDNVEITATRWAFPLATFMWADETFWVWNSGRGMLGYWERCYSFAEPLPRPRHDERGWRLRIIGNMMRWGEKALIASVRRYEDAAIGQHYTRITIYKPPIGSSFAELAKECIGTKP